LSRDDEFSAFLKQQQIKSFKHVGYLQLIEYVADFKAPSVHVCKSRIWTLRQLYHFLAAKWKSCRKERLAVGLP